MTKLTSYDLQQVISKKFVPSLESEQEIEIETDEVVINQIQTTDSEIEELAEDTASAVEASDNIDDVENTTETLESLIYSMESSILTGGFDVRNAQIANIALESIATQYDIDSSYLTFGMEEVGEDGEAETKSTIDKAKSMLSALKDNASALLNKMYNSALSALGNTTALSEKLIVKASQIKSSVDASNKGNVDVKLPKSVKRRLTLDGKTILPQDQYLNELKRLTAKYNSAVKVYADSNVLSEFSKEVLKGASGSDANPVAKKAMSNVVRELSSGVSKRVKSTDNTEEFVSDVYLGGARIHMLKPTAKAVQQALTAKEEVSQEGWRAAGAATTKFDAGLLLTTLGLAGMGIGVTISTVFGGLTIAALAKSVGFSIALGLGQISLVFAIVAVLSYYGAKKGLKMMGEGWKEWSAEIKKAIEALKARFTKVSSEATEVGTTFELETSTSSMEAEEVETSVQSLNANQVKAVTDIVLNTANTTKTMKAELNKRKALIKDMDTLTKEMAKAEGNNSALTSAANTFIKRYIKETIKFEMQLASHTVGVMKAALAYAEASNGAKAAEPEASDDEKKTAE